MLATTNSDHSKADDKLHDDATEVHCTSTSHAQHEYAQHEHTPHKRTAQGPPSVCAHTSGPCNSCAPSASTHGARPERGRAPPRGRPQQQRAGTPNAHTQNTSTHTTTMSTSAVLARDRPTRNCTSTPNTAQARGQARPPPPLPASQQASASSMPPCSRLPRKPCSRLPRAPPPGGGSTVPSRPAHLATRAERTCVANPARAHAPRLRMHMRSHTLTPSGRAPGPCAPRARRR